MSLLSTYHLIRGKEWAVILLLAMGLLYPLSAFPQSTTTSKAGDENPNKEPYKTERGIGYHILASPSYLLHWVTRPVGYAIKYAEDEYPHWFEGKRGPYGFLPLIEIGGEQGFAAGVLLYHDHLFLKDHRARAEILFGSQVYNEFDLQYDMPVKGIPEGILSLEVRYENDPERAYYQNNNDEDLSYASEFGSIDVQYNQRLNSWLHAEVNLGYRDRTIKTSTYEDDFDERIPSSLLGNTQLFSVGSNWTFNYKNGQKRTVSGTQYEAGASWTQSTTNANLKFLEYRGEVHHFLPVPILPKTRRVGVKVQLRKQENIGSTDIPFYELASLGGTRDLRGFPSNRFRGHGTVLVTAEYRYPIWDFMDIVVFTDQGQPFIEYSDIALSDFRSSYGFGFHLLSQQGLAFRSEFAFSNEGGRFIISITPNF
ncbi:BamA/TamA family outer membrane protein [Fodinibius sp. Rm-B-1B1-1]|uniref:BamA/TamA family outer membrane protein n=1 Tax=Fodinibius alkaliphilus TaxID=3140241 RepID=UPI00315A3935